MNTVPDIEAIWLEYHYVIFHFIRRRVVAPGSSHELAEDFTQETFRKAFEAIQNGVEIRHVGGWLFQIARSVIADFYRDKRRHLRTLPWDDVWYEPARDPSPYEATEQAITKQRVRHAVGRLSDSQCVVITRRLDGYEFEEIATEIDKPYGAVKALQNRGYENLRIWLKWEAS